MRKIAVFGNAGAGKSTLARQLAEATGLPLYSLDKIKFRSGGEPVPHDQYLSIHSDLINQSHWIIDGYGCMSSAWQRFAVADTLIYIDLPLALHGWWVTKRLLKGIFADPEGWPENSPILRGSLNSYKVLWLCHRKLTPSYRRLVVEMGSTKSVYHLKSPGDIRKFVSDIRQARQPL